VKGEILQENSSHQINYEGPLFSFSSPSKKTNFFPEAGLSMKAFHRVCLAHTWPLRPLTPGPPGPLALWPQNGKWLQVDSVKPGSKILPTNKHCSQPHFQPSDRELLSLIRNKRIVGKHFRENKYLPASGLLEME